MGASTSTSLFAEGGAGTLRLLMYLAAALVLMVADHRGGHLHSVRQVAAQAMDPLYWLAAAPARAIRAVNSNLSTRVELASRNEALSRELLLANARLHRLSAVQQENRRLRALMGGTEPHALSVQLATLLDIDLDPFRHRVVLDSGSRHGVRVGLAIVDASGVMGQVVATSGSTSTAILISDPNHAIPVQVRRSGVRTIAFGTGRTDALVLPNVPPSADVRVGDELVTSGLGGTFPAGFPVARLTSLEPDPTRLFLVGHAAPASALNRSGEVLLVWTGDAAAAGPPAPAGPAVDGAAPPAPSGDGDSDAAPAGSDEGPPA
jgi:rod shape-determining protein MreC